MIHILITAANAQTFNRILFMRKKLVYRSFKISKRRMNGAIVSKTVYAATVIDDRCSALDIVSSLDGFHMPHMGSSSSRGVDPLIESYLMRGVRMRLTGFPVQSPTLVLQIEFSVELWGGPSLWAYSRNVHYNERSLSWMGLTRQRWCCTRG